MAADSPTPGTDRYCVDGSCSVWQTLREGHWHAAPSPVDTTEPPAEAQQDDVERVAAALEAVAIRDLGPDAGFPMEDYARAAIAALAARPSADTETLRRVRELADQLENDGSAALNSITPADAYLSHLGTVQRAEAEAAVVIADRIRAALSVTP